MKKAKQGQRLEFREKDRTVMILNNPEPSDILLAGACWFDAGQKLRQRLDTLASEYLKSHPGEGVEIGRIFEGMGQKILNEEIRKELKRNYPNHASFRKGG